MNGEVSFWCADKHQNLLQVDSITMGVRSQACPKYPKQICDIFAISQGKREGRSIKGLINVKGFLIDIVILGVYGQECPNYLK